ncbi:hypothetical protein AX14_006235 [Amanita brunnescens Koide BX004]|nr:hypothetical protein AX14_006235 [Amanita brunnescens Koide BX004]
MSEAAWWLRSVQVGTRCFPLVSAVGNLLNPSTRMNTYMAQPVPMAVGVLRLSRRDVAKNSGSSPRQMRLCVIVTSHTIYDYVSAVYGRRVQVDGRTVLNRDVPDTGRGTASGIERNAMPSAHPQLLYRLPIAALAPAKTKGLSLQPSVFIIISGSYRNFPVLI